MNNVRLILIIALLSACSKSNEELPSQERISVVDIPVIINSEGPKYDGPLFQLEKNLSLGIDDGDPEWQIFNRYISAEIGMDSILYLMNLPGYTVYIVSPDGALLGQFGGRGSGPGEFELPTRMFWLEDVQELWINDMRLARVSRFTSNGDLIDTINYSRHRQEWDRLQYLGDGRFLGEKHDLTSSRTETTNRYGFLMEDFSWERDFLSLPGQRNFQSGERNWRPLPFQGIPRVECHISGRIVVGRPYESRLYIYDKLGVLNLIIEHEWDAPKVLEQEKRDWVEGMRNSPVPVDPSFLSKVQLPDRRPAFSSIRIDSKGRVWVQRSRSGPSTDPRVYQFDVFDVNGEWLGTQSLDFIPLMIHSYSVYQLITSREHGPRFVRYSILPLHQGLDG